MLSRVVVDNRGDGRAHCPEIIVIDAKGNMECGCASGGWVNVLLRHVITLSLRRLLELP